MPTALLQAAGRPLLGAGDRDLLRARAAEGVRRARRAGECLVAITVALAPGVDPTAVAVASRRRGEDWFCFEHPDRDRFALATRRSRGGARRPRRGALRRASPHAGARCSPAAPRPTAGAPVVAVGGFAFAPEGGARRTGRASSPRRCTCPRWRSRAAASEVHADAGRRRRSRRRRRRGRRAPARRAPRWAARAAAAARPRPDRALSRGQRDAARALRVRGGAGGRAHPRRSAGQDRARPRGPGPRAARARPRGGARRPARGVPVVLHLLRGAGESAFVAASPELLVRRDGLRAGDAGAGRLDAPQRRPGGRRPPRRAAAALRQGPRGAGDRHPAHRAGPAPGERVGDGGRGARRGADGQHPAPGHADPRAARASRSARSSSPACCIRRPPSAASRSPPPRRSSRRSRASTAAGTRGRWGGRTPTRTASSASRCAARCSTGAVARCYAGVGVVRDSDPAAELAETEVKLQALLPVLAG